MSPTWIEIEPGLNAKFWIETPSVAAKAGGATVIAKEMRLPAKHAPIDMDLLIVGRYGPGSHLDCVALKG